MRYDSLFQEELFGNTTAYPVQVYGSSTTLVQLLGSNPDGRKAKGAAKGASLGIKVPVIGAELAVVTGFVGGMVGYFGGSKIGNSIYNAGKKAASTAKTVERAALNGLKAAGGTLINGIRNMRRKRKGILN